MQEPLGGSAPRFIAEAALHRVFDSPVVPRDDTPLEAAGWSFAAWPVLVLAVGDEAAARGSTCRLTDEQVVGVRTFGDLVSVIADGIQERP
jgi:hypothetical protein